MFILLELNVFLFRNIFHKRDGQPADSQCPGRIPRNTGPSERGSAVFIKGELRIQKLPELSASGANICPGSLRASGEICSREGLDYANECLLMEKYGNYLCLRFCS